MEPGYKKYSKSSAARIRPYKEKSSLLTKQREAYADPVNYLDKNCWGRSLKILSSPLSDIASQRIHFGLIIDTFCQKRMRLTCAPDRFEDLAWDMYNLERPRKCKSFTHIDLYIIYKSF